jgi:hypothetical protein
MLDLLLFIVSLGTWSRSTTADQKKRATPRWLDVLAIGVILLGLLVLVGSAITLLISK